MKTKMAIVAPASNFPLTPVKKSLIIKAGVSLGYQIVWGKHVQDCTGFLAGSDADRAEDIMHAFADKDIEIIMAIRGGYGCARLLNKLDWKFIKNHPKIFVGFSDTTAFQNALLAKAKLPSITGFLAGYWTKQLSAQLKDNLSSVLKGNGVVLKNLTALTSGQAKGVLVGGCLSVFIGLLGTPYMPKLKNKILLLEDVGEAPYKIDRMLTHLENAGVFDLVNGVVVWDFYRCSSCEDNKDEVNQVLNEHFGHLKIPVVSGVFYSHGPEKIVLPFGTKTIVDANEGIVYIDGMKKKY